METDKEEKKEESKPKKAPQRRLRKFRGSKGRRPGDRPARRNNSQRLRRRERRQGNGSQDRPLRRRRFPRRRIILFIRNLSKYATNQDLKRVFQRYGPLQRCGVHYTPQGDSKQTAIVEYVYADSATLARRKLNYFDIRGRQIKIELRRRGGEPRSRRRGILRNRRRRDGERNGRNDGFRRRFRRNYDRNGSNDGGRDRNNRGYNRNNGYGRKRNYSNGGYRRNYKNYNHYD